MQLSVPQRRGWWSMLRVLSVVALGLHAFSVSLVTGQDASRVTRVERGLIPAVVFEGQPDSFPLAERMRRYGAAGVSIAVIRDWQVDWVRGYGMADVARAAPVTAETLFQVGSISKPIAAMLALTLVQSGRLTLDTDVTTWLRTWKLPASRFITAATPVTLRRLLSHTAGVSVYGFPGYQPGQVLPSLLQVLNGTPPANTPAVAVDSELGTWRYSGGGYAIAQQALVDVTGETFEQLARERLFRPLRMDHSTFEAVLSPALSKLAATGYVRGVSVQGGHLAYPEMAAAGLWTTASDLARWSIELQKASVGRAHQVLSQPLASLMTTAQVAGQGLGPRVEGAGMALRISHTGVNEGFEASWVAYPRLGLGAVVLMNGSHTLPLADEVIRSVGREYRWPGQTSPARRRLAAVSVSALEKLVGEYEVRSGFRVRVFVDESQLFLEAPGVDRLRLFPESEVRYLSDEDASLIHTFVTDSSGTVVALRIEQSGQAFNASRLR